MAASLSAHRNRRLTGTRLALSVTAVAALTASLTACGGAIGEEASDDAFKIGLIAPMTGPVVPEATAMQRGFYLAIDKINADGGVLGKQVEVVEVDDQADAAKSTQLAQRLITQDGVDYLFGTIPGDTTAAVAQVAQSAGVPFSSAILGDPGFCSDLFFPFGEPNGSMLNGLVPHMMKENGPKVALVGNDYAFPHGYFADATKLIEDQGGTVVLEEYSPMGTADWQPVVSKINSAKPDWVLTAAVGSDAIALMTQADQAGLVDKAPFTGVSLIADFYPALTERIEGLTLAGRYSDSLDNEANSEFVEAFREKYDFQDPIPSVAANTYVGVQVVADAVEEAKSTDGKAIASALEGASVTDSVFGAGSFSKDRFFLTDTERFEIRPGGDYAAVESFGPDTPGITPQCQA